MSMMDSHSVLTPLPRKHKFAPLGTGVVVDVERYRRLVGRLLYLGRPYLAFATQQLSQYLQHPTESQWWGAKRVVRYLRGTLTRGLFFPADSDLRLEGYCDSDWAM